MASSPPPASSLPLKPSSNASLSSISVPTAPVQLNVGGHRFTTTRETLLSVPDTLFHPLLSDRFQTSKDEQGAIFIDRDGQFFAPILTFLRTKDVSIPSTLSLQGVLREARYFLIGPLIDALESPDAPKSHPDPHALTDPWHREARKFMSQHTDALRRFLHILVKEQGHDHVTVALQQDPAEIISEPYLRSNFQGPRSICIELTRAKICPLLGDGVVLWLLEQGYRAVKTMDDMSSVSHPRTHIELCFHRSAVAVARCPLRSVMSISAPHNNASQ